jgi:DNA-binding NarL/FixJ family response regulator
MIRLILADDHPVFVGGLRAVLAAEADIEVAAVATNGREALAAATAHIPDVAVLDISMPDGDGLSVCAGMRAAGLPTRVLVLTMFDDDENVLAAMRAGAFG